MIMEQVFHYLSTPAGILVAIFGALLILYFMLKKLVKLALLVVLVLFGLAGYYYFQDPATMPQKMKQTLQGARARTESAVEKGKGAYRTGREIYDKGKELSQTLDKLKGTPQQPPSPERR
jgi:membrane protein implicated in regulation of membrane protease activity